MANTLTKEQVDQFLQANNIGLNMTEADTMAAINANPSAASAWQGLANPQAQTIDQQVDAEIASRQAAIPDFGKLAEPSYKDFTPYGEAAPEFTPFSQSMFTETPDYQFRLDEGNKAIDRASSARGNFYSGAALKEATQYGSDLASNEYSNAYNRYNADQNTEYNRYTGARDRYNQDFGTSYSQAQNNSDTLYSRLGGLANTGQSAINTGVNLNTGTGNTLASIYGQGANAAAGTTIAGANNTNQAIGSVLQNTFGTSSYRG